MGDVIPNTRFRRVSARERAKLRARFARQRPWEGKHPAMVDEADAVAAGKPKAKPTRRR